jgi:alanine dehydrogenase
VTHYCVANMPGAVPRTSTFALTTATMPYVKQLAQKGLAAAARSDPAIASGINTLHGKVTHPAVAEALGQPYTPLEL